MHGYTKCDGRLMPQYVKMKNQNIMKESQKF